MREILLPDIGDFKDVDVIEILVKPGDEVGVDTPLVMLESDKATMEIPSPAAGRVAEVLIHVGDKISEGSRLVRIDEHEAAAGTAGGSDPAPPDSPAPEPPPASAPATLAIEPGAPAASNVVGLRAPPPAPPSSDTVGMSASSKAHASPSVRRFARELGVDLGLVQGTGPKRRIVKEDVKTFVKGALRGTAVGRSEGFALPEIPPVDFSRFGEIEPRPLTKIKRLTGQNLQRAWIVAPHVTQFDEADVTELEEFRRENKDAAAEQGVKLTLLAFLLKAAVVALRKFPEFNASLAPGGETLILKKYYHLGFAVDTPEGLVVPVLRDVDKKGLHQIAREIGELSERARARKLGPADMQGGTFTISSLGGIGGTAFTPIINVPEVAILGVSRTITKPVYADGQFVPRLILPLSLSYDHRVIDGVAGARFTTFLATVLADIRKVLL
ncbi:MAG: dihydrolipoyllysine-residue acetyltransferase [Gammaproteobacteria bacterium]